MLNQFALRGRSPISSFSKHKNAGLSPEQLDAYWMPFTGNRDFKSDPRLIVNASGSYYKSADGRSIYDGVSGLWTCGAGHCHPKIADVVHRQLLELDYGPTFQFGHPKAFELAHRLRGVMPAGLDHVFFTNSGSESADTSIKIARAYWRMKGKSTKTKLIGRIRGYHGVNIGGISIGGIGPNRTPFGQGLDVDHLPHTILKTNQFSRGLPANGVELAEELLDLIALHGDSNIAAVAVEPVAVSGGVIPPPEGYLKRLREICDQHDILLIFDEVITGFGRMGSMTAAEEFGVVPDILNVAKQLTNGAIPMGAVIVKGEIYQAFMEQNGPSYLAELPHGYTYSGHPVACAAGLATLNLLESEALIERVKNLSPVFENALHSLKGSRYISDIRNYGFAGSLQLESAPGEPARRPYELAMQCWKKGYYIRYSGDTVQLGLPFIAEREEIDRIINVIGDSLKELT